MARVGILGGTFNPPHLGHLICAQEALSQLELDRVLLVPVALPPHKEPRDDPGAAERLELCRLATVTDDRLEVSAVEVERGGASYTVDTLRELRERAPSDEMTFIAGGDMARSLPTWREPATILELARFAVAERSGTAREDVLAQLAPLGVAERVAFFDMPRIDISSTAIRRRVAERRPIRYLVPDAVAARIEAAGLYRPAPVGAA